MDFVLHNKRATTFFKTDFTIKIVSFLIKIFIFDYFCQYREVKNIKFGHEDSRAQKW